MSRRLWAFAAVILLLFFGAAFLASRHQRPHRHTGALPSSDGLGLSAVAFPNGLAADKDGNVYLNEADYNRVLKISPDRQVTIAAGNGSRGYSGDGGTADRASLASPTSIALDSAGNLFIADTGNRCIRRVDATTHTITRIPGETFQGEWPGGIAQYSSASPGSFPPISIAADGSGNLFVGIPHGGGVRRLDALSYAPTQIVGPGLLGDPSDPDALLGPYWLAVDEHGILFIADPTRNTVSQAYPLGNDVHRLAGGAVCGFAGDGGPAESALLCFPEALAARNNKLFIADTGNNRIRKVDLMTGIITTVAGNGQSGGAGDGGPAVDANLSGPTGITVNADGEIYIADTGNKRIRSVDPKTGIITTWATDSDLAPESQ